MNLSALASALELEFHGDANRELTALAPVASADHSQLTFVVSPRYRDALVNTRAGAVIVPESLAEFAPCDTLISSQPYASYAAASQLLYPDYRAPAGISASALVDPDCQVAADASVGPGAIIEQGAVIAAGVQIGAGCCIGRGVTVSCDTVIKPNVTINADCQIGERCRIQSGAVIGSDGFGYAPTAKGWLAIRQVGRVIIGDDVEVGANTTIDRGALSDTIIGDGVILDNQIQIAHNVVIGERTAIAACVGIAGSTVIGKNCTIGGKSAIVGHLSITDNVHLTATSFVTRSIEESGSYSSGMPLLRTSQWRRLYTRLGQLDALFRLRRKQNS